MESPKWQLILELSIRLPCSESYKKLTHEERKDLSDQAEAQSNKTVKMTKQEVIKPGRKIFKDIEPSVRIVTCHITVIV